MQRSNASTHRRPLQALEVRRRNVAKPLDVIRAIDRRRRCVNIVERLIRRSICCGRKSSKSKFVRNLNSNSNANEGRARVLMTTPHTNARNGSQNKTFTLTNHTHRHRSTFIMTSFIVHRSSLIVHHSLIMIMVSKFRIARVFRPWLCPCAAPSPTTR